MYILSLPDRVAQHCVAGLLAIAALTATHRPVAALDLKPVSIAAAARAPSHVTQLGIALSPDEQWLARSYRLGGETSPRANRFFTITGSTAAFGNERMQTQLLNLRTGETADLGAPAASVWGAAWSPDGRRVAFYSDQRGKLGLWVWEKYTRRQWQVPGIVVRPWAQINPPRWLPDSKSVLCKILPAGMTLRQANALVTVDANGGDRKFLVMPTGAAYVEFRSPLTPEQLNASAESSVTWTTADLAIVDVVHQKVARIATRRPIWYYNLSPDAHTVAYAVATGLDPLTYQAYYDIHLYDIRQRSDRILLKHAPLASLAWSWAPNSKAMAFIFATAPGRYRPAVVDMTGSVHDIDLNVGVGMGDAVNLWSRESDRFLAISNGAIWQYDIASAHLQKLPGVGVRGLVSAKDQNTAATIGPDGAIIALVHQKQGSDAIVAIDGGTGAQRTLLQEPGIILPVQNIALSHDAIVYVTQNLNNRAEVWQHDLSGPSFRQLTHATRLWPGDMRLLHWKTQANKELSGALLLPPNYVAGTRLPLVVWVYGGTLGSASVHVPGLAMDDAAFNMSILASRGYAVLFPDTPLHTGQTSADLLDDVMQGVDAAVTAGIADPDRLAVMGQSYGSYSVFALITQTTRFKAAIVSGVVNQDYMSGYLGLDSDGVASETAWYESGQGNMGGTPWQFPDRYVKNSPIWSFDHIQTPILMAVGSQDITNRSAPDAVFAALQRLGKPIDYVIYRGEGHVIENAANVIDFWNRRLSFLAEKLDVKLDRFGRVVLQDR